MGRIANLWKEVGFWQTLEIGAVIVALFVANGITSDPHEAMVYAVLAVVIMTGIAASVLRIIGKAEHLVDILALAFLSCGLGAAFTGVIFIHAVSLIFVVFGILLVVMVMDCYTARLVAKKFVWLSFAGECLVVSLVTTTALRCW